MDDDDDDEQEQQRDQEAEIMSNLADQTKPNPTTLRPAYRRGDAARLGSAPTN